MYFDLFPSFVAGKVSTVENLCLNQENGTMSHTAKSQRLAGTLLLSPRRSIHTPTILAVSEPALCDFKMERQQWKCPCILHYMSKVYKVNVMPAVQVTC